MASDYRCHGCRQKKIAEGLDAAGRAERDLKLAQRSDKCCVIQKKTALEILEKANKTASEIVEEAKQTARTEGDRLIANAKAEIDLEVKSRKRRASCTSFRISGCGCGTNPFGSSVDASAHNQLVEQLAAQL